MYENGMEVGIGHNWRRHSRRKTKESEPARQLYPAATSILDIPPNEIRERRLKLVNQLCERGRFPTRKTGASGLANWGNDHHQRFNAWGQARRLMNFTADDAQTLAPDDTLADHLYIAAAEDPILSAFGMAEHLAMAAELIDEDTHKEREEAEKYEVFLIQMDALSDDVRNDQLNDVVPENNYTAIYTKRVDHANDDEAILPKCLYAKAAKRHCRNVKGGQYL